MIPNPRNETTMHYILKCLGFIILRGLNCKFVSTECLLRQTHDEQGINVNYNGRKVVDVLGYQLVYGKGWITRSIEAKATYEDFKSGYTLSGADYMYLISPKGVIPTNKIAKHYGHIEIDFDNIKTYCNSKKKLIYPVYQGDKEGWYMFSKKPKRLELNEFQKVTDIQEKLWNVSIRNTSELQKLFERSALGWIPNAKNKL